MSHPIIIQGGMGVAVSGWPLARAVSRLGQLGVVSGTAPAVFLAKEGQQGPVGVNYLEKIQLPTLPSLYGAMLAGVDYILMGAGIPRAIPGALDLLAQGQPATLPLDVQGALPGEKTTITFDPRDFCGAAPEPLNRPLFLGIAAS